MDNTNDVEESVLMTSSTILQDCDSETKGDINGKPQDIVKVNGDDSIATSVEQECRDVTTESLEEKSNDAFEKTANESRIHLKRKLSSDSEEDLSEGAVTTFTGFKKRLAPALSLLDRHPFDIKINKEIPTIDDMILSKIQDDPNNKLGAETLASSNANNLNILKNNPDLLKKLKASNGDKQLEYAQYLGLQPSVKFKCFRCSEDSFANYNVLKEHQKKCLLERKIVPQTSAPSSSNQTNFRITRKVYLCSACGTYYENWNLFLHMRTVHKRYICLFCLGMFSNAEKLSSHLESKHNIIEKKFTDNKDLMNTYSGSCFFMCCTCEHVFTERDNFSDHCCSDYEKPCTICGLKGSHKIGCKGALKSKSGIAKINTTNSKVSKLQKLTKTKAKPEVHVTGDSMPHAEDNAKILTDDEPNFNPAALCVVDMVDNDRMQVDQVSDVNREEKNSSEETLNQPNVAEEFASTVTSAKVTIDDESCNEPGNAPIENHTDQEEIMENIEMTQDDNLTEKCINELSEIPAENVSKEVMTPEVSENCDNIKDEPTDTSFDKKLIEDKNENESDVYQSECSNSNLPEKIDEEQTHHTAPEASVESQESDPINNIDEQNESSLIDELNVSSSDSLNENENDEDNSQEEEEVQEQESLKTTIKVPKLTVKLPKSFSSMPLDSSSDSESDQDKLTMDDDESQHNTTAENLYNSDGKLGDEDNEQKSDDGTGDEGGAGDEDENGKFEKTNSEDNNSLNHIAEVSKDTPLMLSDNGEKITNNENTRRNSLDNNIIIAGEDITIFEVTLEQPLHKYPILELLKKFLGITIHSCLYCNHVRKIAINGKQIGLHLVAQHRFRAIVESITAEELLPETIVSRITQSLPELEEIHFNLENYDSTDKSLFVPYDGLHECFRCRFITTVHKELYLHNRKCHQKAIVLCTMCKSTFYTYSELLCHFCPGTYEQNVTRELLYRCCLCELDNLPSAFRLMVHLRKRHHTCDVCLESCGDQSRLSNHVWKHKLQHLCYRCGISYRNKPDITKHLFWKHGTESVLCKRCLQKKWPHVYHFCILPSSFVCEECGLSFTKAVALKVHKRLHNDYRPYPCTDCEQQFVSKKLLLKHAELHKEPLPNNMNINNTGSINSTLTNDVSSNIVPNNSENEETKSHKSKKSKKCDNKESLEDVVADLPALNLSESDSSDESGAENKITATVLPGSEVAKETLNNDVPDVEDEITPAPVMLGIWDNFRTYQASIDKTDGIDAGCSEFTQVLHVCQSDHDYCDIDDIIQKIEEPVSAPSCTNGPTSPKKSVKTPKHKSRDSSSSSDSSSSNSSCSCGENCSCSSSSSSSNSSDSSSDSDSSSSEAKRRIHARKERRAARALAKKQTADTNPTEVVNVAPTKPPELPIFESDLDTDESETDEDFYDEHPQRLANKLLAEKRNQLIMMASLDTAPDVRNGLTMDLSRTSTPSLPPDEVQVVKKVKTKKRKKDKKSRSTVSAPSIVSTPIVPPISLKINIPKNPDYPNQTGEHTVKIILSRPSTPKIEKPASPLPLPLPMVPPLQVPKIKPQQISGVQRTSIDDSKRASKRRRIPNKFYGYSSDEEAGLLKPQAPPQLTWRKEDLPEQPPKIIEPPPRVPPLPVHQMLSQQQITLTRPPSDLSDNGKSSPSDDSSSDEGALHISQPVAPIIPATARPIPVVPRQAREGESVYCYCRCPYDEVSEMIACDGNSCAIEWFHFECVGIMVPPKGKWFCPECRQKQQPQAPRPDFFC